MHAFTFFRNLPLATPFRFIHHSVAGPLYIRTGPLSYRRLDGGPDLSLVYGGFAVQSVA
jgi:hypothetical protein